MSKDNSNIIPLRNKDGRTTLITTEKVNNPVLNKNRKIVKVAILFISLSVLFFSILVFLFKDEKKQNKISNTLKETTSTVDAQPQENARQVKQQKITVCVPNSPFPTEEKERALTCISN